MIALANKNVPMVVARPLGHNPTPDEVDASVSNSLFRRLSAAGPPRLPGVK